MISLLAQPKSPFPNAAVCPPGRTVDTFTIKKNGYLYRFEIASKLAVEDPYLALVKATAFAIANNSPYPGGQPPKEIKDFLIKTNLQF